MTTTAATSEEKTKRHGANDAVQHGWLNRNRGQQITVRFVDGTRIGGMLVGWDTYTIEVKIAGRDETVLVQKHGVLFLARREPKEDEKQGESASGR